MRVCELNMDVYTDLLQIFMKMDNNYLKYNWLISDYECYPQNNKNIKILNGEPIVISGDKLVNILIEEDFQWIWGVFSAFEKELSYDIILSESIPYADGNNKVWNERTLQHSRAKIEIIAWDSSKALVKSKDDSIIDLLIQSFPNSKEW